MKKFSCIILLILFTGINLLKSQVTLENSYPGTGFFNSAGGGYGAKQFYLVKLEVSGEKYISMDMQNQTLTFYNLNHSLYTSISYSNVTLLGYYTAIQEKNNASILYISESLFDTDPQIEFLYFYSVVTGNTLTAITQIINQDGSVLFSATGEAPLVRPGNHNQYYPIYNTALGTKMILSKIDGSARVYSLGGVFTPILTANGIPSETELSVSPNPTMKTNLIVVNYSLPDGLISADLKIIDNLGHEVKKYSIGKDMDTLLIDPSEFVPGIYYYSIISNSKVIGVKKSIVIE